MSTSNPIPAAAGRTARVAVSSFHQMNLIRGPRVALERIAISAIDAALSLAGDDDAELGAAVRLVLVALADARAADAANGEVRDLRPARRVAGGVR